MWNSIKLILNGPIAVILLIRVRIREAVARSRARQTEQAAEYAAC